MIGRNVPRVLLAALAMTAVVAVNAALFRGRMTAWVADIAGPVLAPVTERLAGARGSLGAIIGHGDVVAENRRLSSEVERLRRETTGIDALRRDIEFYRSAAGIMTRIGRRPVEAGIFAYLRAGNVRQAVINRGERDGIAVGDVAVTAAGALVGVVREVFDGHAVVLTVGDPAFEVAGRILGTEITGLVRFDGVDGLVLDLVSRDEEVSEGQTVVTSGNDRFPPALMVGTVRSVDITRATLFTVVRLDPTVGQPVEGRVLIVAP